MSASIIGGVIGAGIGLMFGNPALGWMIGSAAGALLFPEQIEGPRLQDLRAQSSEYGRPIPIVYGTIALGGNVIWASDLIEVANEEGGKGGPEVTSYSYFANFAVAICEGEVSLGRIWAGPDKRLIWDGATLEGAESGALMRFYSGTEDQLPDSLIESYMGAGQVPAYRGTAYVVFENFPVEKDGNRIPFLTVEVGTVDINTAPENLGYNWPHLILTTDDLYFVFYYGSYEGVVIRYKHDHSLYAHYTYPSVDWSSLNRFVLDEPNQRIIVWSVFGSYKVVDWTTGEMTSHPVLTAPPGADPGTSATLFGAVVHNGQYVFAGRNETTHDVTLWVVDPATNTCTAAYVGTLGGAQPRLLRKPHDSSSYLYVYTGATGAAGEVFRVAIASGLTGSAGLGATGAVSSSHCYMEVDQTTGRIWTVNHNTSTSLLQVSVHSPSTGLIVAHTDLASDFYRLSGLMFVPGKAYVYGQRWLATDHFRMFEDDGTDLGEVTGGQYGIQTPMSMIYDDLTGELVMARENAVLTFGDPADPTSVNLLVPGTSEQEADNKNLGENDASVAPQGQPLSEVVLDLSERAGLDPSQVDVTQLADDMVDGYAIANQMDVKSAVMALAPAYFFDAVESGGLIKYVKRGGATVTPIDDDELGAYESGSQPVEDLETTRIMDEELPRIVTARYLLEATKYDAATKIAKRLVGHSGSEAALDLPLVLTDTKAQEVAEVNLHGPWVARLTYRFSLPRKYAYLEPTDIVAVKGYTMRIATIKQTGGRYQVEAVHDDANVYVPNVVVTETVPPPSGGVATVPATVLELM